MFDTSPVLEYLLYMRTAQGRPPTRKEPTMSKHSKIVTLGDVRDAKHDSARMVRIEAAAKATADRLAREDAALKAYPEIGYMVTAKGRLYYAFLDGNGSPETSARILAALIFEIDARHACDQEGVTY